MYILVPEQLAHILPIQSFSNPNLCQLSFQPLGNSFRIVCSPLLWAFALGEQLVREGIVRAEEGDPERILGPAGFDAPVAEFLISLVVVSAAHYDGYWSSLEGVRGDLGVQGRFLYIFASENLRDFLEGLRE